MYFATEVWPTSMPSLSSSPWMRGAPERVGQAHLADQPPDLGRHARSTETCPRLPAPEGAKASAMPAQNRLRPNNRHCIENGRHQPVQPYKDEAIKPAQGRALGCAPTQNDQLL